MRTFSVKIIFNACFDILNANVFRKCSKNVRSPLSLTDTQVLEQESIMEGKLLDSCVPVQVTFPPVNGLIGSGQN